MRWLGWAVVVWMGVALPAWAVTPAAPVRDWGILIYPATDELGDVGLFFAWEKREKAAFAEVQALKPTRLVLTTTWKDIEPEAGEVDLDHVTRHVGHIEAMGAGVLFGLQMVNTTQKELPEDLQEVAWDSDAMKQRVVGIIDRVVPLMARGRVQYLSLGNEVDVYFAAHPDELAAYGRLMEHAMAHVRTVYPHVKTGVTVTFDSVRTDAAMVVALNRASDVFMLTYYPITDGKVRDPQAPFVDIPEAMRVAGGKPLVFQEAGYPSAALLGSTEEKQAAFVTAMLAAQAKFPDAVAYVNLFAQHDFNTNMCNQLTAYYGVEANPYFAASICTLGLKHSDGTPKKAWALLKDDVAPAALRGTNGIQ